ncbi:MAG: arsenosugar biosynthesis radical SAM protein ArsS [Gemmatimonadaceae bacterium]|nr:arsenosugar biosynthesis radical SAM protein ArsS [Gloeobacterales cyanobacterium ES-bin-141]
MVIKVNPTLQKREHPLASASSQQNMLSGLPLDRSFPEALDSAGRGPLKARGVEVLQLNLGKRCNQTCRHCHVDAGPDRQEVMPRAVIEACFSLLERSRIQTVDITGGAPELHPHFREIVERARALGCHVMDRCNLTITRLPNYADLPDFLAAHRVEVVASLPSWAPRQTDAQRGDGVFEDSIQALRRFNELGYGDETGLVLNLVTNPVGAFLPGNQNSLEREWKRELKRRYDVQFNHLYTITNMPISRFLEFLVESGNLEAYMERLVNAFNPSAVEGLMCRSTLSVSWDGKLYDCDFNQMLDMALPRTIFEATPEELEGRLIQVGPHCFGCTAGAGSSCGGATA